MDFQVCRPQKTRVLCHLKEKWNLRHTFGHRFLTSLVCFLTSYLANEWYYTACWLTSLFQIISTDGGYKEHCTMCCVSQDCHSVYQQPRERKFFDIFVARVMQKLYSGNGPFSHILCSFLRAIRRYIDRPERSRRNKMFQILVRGCRSSRAWQRW